MTPPAPDEGHPVVPGPGPGSQPAQLTGDALEAVADLTDLAAGLTARGYGTRLDTTTSTLWLTLTHPQVSAAHHIQARGGFFCWEPANGAPAQPFSMRPPIPITATADAVDVLMHYWMAVEEENQP